ncbi:MAG: N-acetyl-gamma-glutamyl-phosphate reductase [Candidatus Nezhaarchaeales archaeon]
MEVEKKSASVKVGIIGASGYTGGELLRILLGHPEVEVKIATSREYAGEYLFRVHPNLRGLTDLKFTPLDLKTIISTCDVVFTSTPHGASAKLIPQLLEAGLKVIDLSADFRLKDPKKYEEWYGWKHPKPELLQEAVLGLPELHREELKRAKLIACPGCIATASILALAPLVKAGLIALDRIIIDAKMGSSGGGAKPSPATHHAERFGVIRPYAAAKHRHCAEIEQELSLIASREVKVAMSAHAVNIVRGILVTAHTFASKQVSQPELWRAYRGMYGKEPFVRIVKDRKGVYRLPDPKVVVGTNFCDVGFELDERLNRIVALSAIDNMVKGASGQAVQCFNITLGIDERTALNLPGFHPI